MIKKILSMFAVLLVFAQSALASNLPSELWEYIHGALPDAKQRFDSVIELKSGSMYIPLFLQSKSKSKILKLNTLTLKQHL